MNAAARFEPRDPHFEQRVRASFARQAAMATIGASLESIEAGRVVIVLPYATALTQQHGFLHAGMLAAALDSACGYAGSTLMPADAGVLTIEFKINLLAPAQGQRFRMVGEVIKPGRTVTVAEGRAWAIDDAGRERLVATMGATLMAVTGRDNILH
ncbi:PaaI family thioesterase [Ramlibacter sp. AN1015]|uniref:PaaI family thioesterase n=1 Tax=Ramlibacter sp. AN1015 TaxID=3133428 RepID=UPI0030BBA651